MQIAFTWAGKLAFTTKEARSVVCLFLSLHTPVTVEQLRSAGAPNWLRLRQSATCVSNQLHKSNWRFCHVNGGATSGAKPLKDGLTRARLNAPPVIVNPASGQSIFISSQAGT